MAKSAVAIGQPFMPWQQLVADVAGEYDPDTGVPYYREVIVTVPRQSGKTTLFLSFQTHRCLHPRWAQPQRSAFTAQTGKDARDKWLDELFPLLKQSKLAPFIRRINEGMGNESVRWKNGSLIRILSSSNSSGHSKTLHQATLDELWHDADSRREQGLRPAMITIPDAQLLACSTAGTELSSVLQRKVKIGREAVAADTGRGVAYFEFSAPDDWDPFDDESFYQFHPALCPDPPCRCGDGRWRHTITIDAILTERAGMELAEFKRAYGNIETGSHGGVIDVVQWGNLLDEASRRADGLSIGVDIELNRERVAVGIFGPRSDELGHVQLLDYQPGTEWIVDRLVELRAALDPISVGMGSRTFKSLEAELKRAGFTVPEKPEEPGRGDLAVMGGVDMAAGCGQLLDAVRQASLRHRGDAALDAAVAAAKTRRTGDTIAWHREDDSTDISPLVAITAARWAYMTRVDLVLDDRTPNVW